MGHPDAGEQIPLNISFSDHTNELASYSLQGVSLSWFAVFDHMTRPHLKESEQTIYYSGRSGYE